MSSSETVTRNKMHEELASFMDINYPCRCEPEDSDCPHNNFEADHILDFVGDDVVAYIASLDPDMTRDEVINSLRSSIFVEKEVTHYEH